MPDNDSALSLIRAALGQEVEDLAIAGKVKEYSSQDYELNDLARSLAGKLPEEVVRQVYNGKLQSPLVTLDTALSGYAAYKAEEGAREKDAALRIKKLRNDLKGCLGAQAGKGWPGRHHQSGSQRLPGPLAGEDEAPRDGDHRQEPYDALPAPPDEGRAEEHGLPTGRLHGDPGAWVEHGGS